MTKPISEPIAPATLVTRAGRRPEWTGIEGQPGAVVNPPVWRASTHLYPDSTAHKAGAKNNADGRFFYGRRGAPTQWALAEALTELEPGAAGTMLYPSGVAAIAGALLCVLRPGDVLLMTDHAYEPSRILARGFLKDFGIETRWFDPANLSEFEAACCDRTRAVLLESPGSLTMEVHDTPAHCAAARSRGITSILDNTWASPLGYAAIAKGADISVMSLTKHVGGHSDLMMGSATASAALYPALRHNAQMLGQVVSPDDASLALRGIRTMALRLERATASALALAEWLQARSEVARVYCPMLAGSPGHALWKRDFTGGCGLIGFTFASKDAKARAAFIDGLSLFGIGYSWGGFESLVTPADPGTIRTATQADPGLGLRLSVGLESPDDLIADLARGFAA
ncbi:MAG: cystathionine beta-lyase, partial [Novosphingobium sp.]